jgi:hypothetical protein
MFFMMSESTDLTPAREVHCDDLVHRIEQNIIETLRGDDPS